MGADICSQPGLHFAIITAACWCQLAHFWFSLMRDGLLLLFVGLGIFGDCYRMYKILVLQFLVNSTMENGVAINLVEFNKGNKRDIIIL